MALCCGLGPICQIFCRKLSWGFSFVASSFQVCISLFGLAAEIGSILFHMVCDVYKRNGSFTIWVHSSSSKHLWNCIQLNDRDQVFQKTAIVKFVKLH